MPPGNQADKPERLPFVLEVGVCAFFIYFGLWSFICHVSVLVGMSFEVLRWLGALAIVGAAVLVWYLTPEQPGVRAPIPYRPFLPWQVSVALAAGAVVLYVWLGNLALLWGIGSLLLILNLVGSTPATQPTPALLSGPPSLGSGRTTLVVLALAGILAIIRWPLMSNNPDDAFYFNAIITLLDHPDWPVLRLDGMHGQPGLPVLLPVYLAHSFEPFIAWLAWVTGMTPFWLYYVFVPSLMAGLAVVVHWVSLRRLVGRGAMVGLLVTFVLLMFWGGRVIGLPLLHMGKGILSTVCVPALVYFALRYIQGPTVRNLLLLALAEVAAIGFSSTGLIIAPGVIGLALAGGWIAGWIGWRSLVLGLFPSAYALAWLFVVAQLNRSYGDIREIGQIRGLQDVIGRGWLTSLLLCAILAAALLPGDLIKWRLRAGYVLALFFVVLSPFTGTLLASQAGAPISWRRYWMVPFYLLAGVATAALWASVRRKALALSSIGVLCIGTLVADSNSLYPAFPYVYEAKAAAPERAVAATAVAATPPGGLILATERVARWVPTNRHAPRLIAVRRLYLWTLAKQFGQAEMRERMALLDYASGAPNGLQLPEVVEAITRRRIDTIVLARGAAERDGLATALTNLGYRRQDVDGYDVWHVARP